MGPGQRSRMSTNNRLPLAAATTCPYAAETRCIGGKGEQQ
jgi:hypothetical protein